MKLRVGREELFDMNRYHHWCHSTVTGNYIFNVVITFHSNKDNLEIIICEDQSTSIWFTCVLLIMTFKSASKTNDPTRELRGIQNTESAAVGISNYTFMLNEVIYG